MKLSVGQRVVVDGKHGTVTKYKERGHVRIDFDDGTDVHYTTVGWPLWEALIADGKVTKA